MFLQKRTIVAYRLETYTTGGLAYGNAKTPTVGTGAGSATPINVISPSITPIVGEYKDLEVVKGYFGASNKIPISKHIEIEFTTPFIGCPAQDTAPKWGPLLQMCGFSKVLTNHIFTYTPSSTIHYYGTLYYYMDGILHQSSGARGSMQIQLTSSDVPYLLFNFTGLYNTPVDGGTAIIGTFANWHNPYPVGSIYTSVMMDDVGINVQSVEIDIGNRLEFRDNIDTADVIIVDRKITGKITWESTTISTHDWFSINNQSTPVALEIIHGDGDDLITISASNVVLSEIGYTEQQGVYFFTANLSFVPTSLDNELTITIEK